MLAPYTPSDFAHSPLLVFYETTRACNLLCKHCRATAQKHRHPLELSESQALDLITQLTRFSRPPLLVLTGGDPVKRPDLFDMIRHPNHVGLDVALTPSATPLVTTDVINRLKLAGLHRLAVSLDGPDAATHDAFRGVPGSFARTLRILADAHEAGLPVQINTTLSRHNMHQIDAIADLLATQHIVLWSVFFLIPTGRATPEQRLTAEEIEQAFTQLMAHSRRQPYGIKTTEAPHYRRYVAQHLPPAAPAPRWVGTNDGRGVMFVSHTGEIYPSGFLPQLCGRLRIALGINYAAVSGSSVHVHGVAQLWGWMVLFIFGVGTHLLRQNSTRPAPAWMERLAAGLILAALIAFFAGLSESVRAVMPRIDVIASSFLAAAALLLGISVIRTLTGAGAGQRRHGFIFLIGWLWAWAGTDLWFRIHYPSLLPESARTLLILLPVLGLGTNAIYGFGVRLLPGLLNLRRLRPRSLSTAMILHNSGLCLFLTPYPTLRTAGSVLMLAASILYLIGMGFLRSKPSRPIYGIDPRGHVLIWAARLGSPCLMMRRLLPRR